MAKPRASPRQWKDYYRTTSKRPPRELIGRVLDHLEWEGRSRDPRTAVEIGFGAGNDTLVLLQRGWHVLAIDAQESAARFLNRRVPPRLRGRLTIVVAPAEEFELPSTDLVYASYSLPFCAPDRFPKLWSAIRSAVRPRGHFAGQLFGDRDEWYGERPMSFHSRRDIGRLTRGWKVELLRETVEEGRSVAAVNRLVPKHWHFFDLILEKPGKSRED
jgi:tellurite methyltransferase